MFSDILDLLLIGYVFWPVLFVFALLIYASIERGKSILCGNFFGVLFIAAVWAHYRTIPPFINIVEFAGIYILVGFLVSLYKYFIILYDFRKNAPAAITKIKKHYSPPTYRLNDKEMITRVESDLSTELDLPYNSVEYDETTNSYHIKYNNCGPIALWWIYWPCYLLSTIFDPIERFIKYIYEKIKGFYNNMAKWFGVKNN